MTAMFQPRRDGGRPVWVTLLGVLLVPLLVAGVFLWGLWNPNERLDTISAAVVNLDEPVEIDGELTPLGRVLAGAMIGAPDGAPANPSGVSEDAPENPLDDEAADLPNVHWQLTSEEDAASGLATGRYAAVVTIPENFSYAATSASRDPGDIEQANINIETSPRARLLDNAITQAVMETTRRVLNETLGVTSVETVLVGMNDLSDGLNDAATGASQLADGNRKLADGTAELATGADELAGGAGQLSSGAGELAGGAGRLADGIGQLSGGARGLASGVDEYVAGAQGIAGGVDELAAGLSALDSGLGQASAGARQLADGQAQLADGVTQYVEGINSIAEPLAGAVDPAIAQLLALRERLVAGGADIPGVDTSEVVAAIDQTVAQLSSTGGRVQELVAGGAALKDGAHRSAEGGRELANGLDRLSGGLGKSAAGARNLAGGAHAFADAGAELSSGAWQLSGGVDQSAAGAGALAGGADRLAGGAGELASGSRQLADGTEALADGAAQSADGSETLADGLADAAGQLPNYSDTERERLARSLVTPVASDERETDALFHDHGVPLFTTVALWAGGLAAFLVLAPLWRRTHSAALGVGRLTLRSAASGALLGGVQGMLAGLVIPLALDYSAGQFGQFLGIATLAGVAFGLLNQGLVAFARGMGRFLSLALLLVAFVAGVVSTVPDVLRAIAGATPLGTAFEGFQSIATETGTLGGTIVVLLLWAGLGVVLIGLAVIRSRRSVDRR